MARRVTQRIAGHADGRTKKLYDRRSESRLLRVATWIVELTYSSLQLGQETTNYAFHKCIVEGLPREPASVEERRDD